MTHRAPKPARIDWAAVLQRCAVAVRGLRGDSHEAIEQDHQTEMNRSHKLRDAIANAERWASGATGERKP